jgi:peptidoglycan L-alanyl-D-glutamate endopeptidase CwlK
MPTLRNGDRGSLVRQLQKKLTESGHDTYGIDGDFGGNTEKALRDYQAAKGLLVTGVADDAVLSQLAIEVHSPGRRHPPPRQRYRRCGENVPTNPQGQYFQVPAGCYRSLAEQNMLNREMLLMALATIRAETESFRPISEGISKYNTSPGGEPFDLYDNRDNLGNTGYPDGSHSKAGFYSAHRPGNTLSTVKCWAWVTK